MKKRRTIVCVVLAVVLLVIVGCVVGNYLSYDIPEGGQAEWLDRRWESYRADKGYTARSGETLLAEQKDGKCVIQVWQVELDGDIFYDTVVWKQGWGDKYRVVEDQFVSREDQRDETMHFGYQDGVWWRQFRVTRLFEIKSLEQHLRIPGSTIVWLVVAAAAVVVLLLTRVRTSEK